MKESNSEKVGRYELVEKIGRGGMGVVWEASPFVTVVMPVRNEGAYIERSLGAVLAQDYPAEKLEVLLADGMSEDDTRQRIAALAAQTEIPVRVVDNPGRIVSTGLNAVLAEARGEIVVRVDGHCEVAPDYVSQAVAALADGAFSGAGGATETVGEDDLSRAIAAAMSSRFGTGGAASRVGRPRPQEVDTILFPAYPKKVLDAVLEGDAKPFDPELVRNQDEDLNHRLRSRGHRLLQTPALRSRYYCRKGLRALWRQYFQYGYYKVRVLRKLPRQMQARHFAPPAFVLALLLSLVALPWTWWPAAAVAGPYAAVNLLASALTAQRAPWRTAPLLPLIYAVLHLAYGGGFLVGLVSSPRFLS